MTKPDIFEVRVEIIHACGHVVPHELLGWTAEQARKVQEELAQQECRTCREYKLLQKAEACGANDDCIA